MEVLTGISRVVPKLYINVGQCKISHETIVNSLVFAEICLMLQDSKSKVDCFACKQCVSNFWISIFRVLLVVTVSRHVWFLK